MSAAEGTIPDLRQPGAMRAHYVLALWALGSTPRDALPGLAYAAGKHKARELHNVISMGWVEIVYSQETGYVCRLTPRGREEAQRLLAERLLQQQPTHPHAMP